MVIRAPGLRPRVIYSVGSDPALRGGDVGYKKDFASCRVWLVLAEGARAVTPGTGVWAGQRPYIRETMHSALNL